MTFTRPVAGWTIAAASALMASAELSPRVEAQRPAAVTTVNWPLHNLDLAGSRYSTMDQINTSNVKTLAPRWLFQYGIIDGVSNQTTPVVVDGVMYVTDPRGVKSFERASVLSGSACETRITNGTSSAPDLWDAAVCVCQSSVLVRDIRIRGARHSGERASKHHRQSLGVRPRLCPHWQ